MSTPSSTQLPPHAPSPGMQSSANGQSFPFPDFAIVSVKTLSKPFSHAAEHKENVPSQSTSAIGIVGSLVVGEAVVGRAVVGSDVVGDEVGSPVGEGVGSPVGEGVGSPVGDGVGSPVGLGVGSSVVGTAVVGTKV